MRQLFAKSALSFAVVFVLVALVSMRSTSAGAAASSEGCMDQWMFNGVWRVKATKVDPIMDGAQQVGWQVTEVWRNGTAQEAAPSDSLLKDQVLELDGGSPISAAACTSCMMSMGVVAAHTFAPAAQYTYVQIFRAPAVNFSAKPKALSVIFDGDRLSQFKSKAQFTTAHYNYHIKLDCTASGAQAQGQGGAYEIQGAQGCMNQWMSNGLWRVRATAIAPNMGGFGQDGWMITEDWASLAHQPIAPGDTNITDQQLVLASGDTIASSSGVISSGSFGQMALHTFAPGGSLTYQQRFILLPFDVSDKPVKLIVTFDAAKQKLATNKPQYKVIPPNFRISFACSK